MIYSAETQNGRTSDRHGFKRGFTLVELLVVIALIASLAAMVLPVFSKVQGKARESACLSNTRQIGMAVQMYCQDYDGVYPYALDPSDKYNPNGWDAYPEFAQAIPDLPLLNEILQPYFRSRDIFRCPADTGFNKIDFSTYPLSAAPSAFARFGTSYAYMTELTARHLTLEQLSAPSKLPVNFDLVGRWHGQGDQLDWRYSTVFADGHSKTVSFTAFVELLAQPL